MLNQSKTFSRILRENQIIIIGTWTTVDWYLVKFQRALGSGNDILDFLKLFILFLHQSCSVTQFWHALTLINYVFQLISRLLASFAVALAWSRTGTQGTLKDFSGWQWQNSRSGLMFSQASNTSAWQLPQSLPELIRVPAHPHPIFGWERGSGTKIRKRRSKGIRVKAETGED